ncbi:MAG: metalloregulator ArsR/SmtB family transcription factor [Actinomycetota bacterium]|nr:metalloregulator ArsR/SmtB family transcription factor [Actinomycetota bacterium]
MTIPSVAGQREGKAADAAVVLRTLADPSRLRIFRALRTSERCVRALVESEGLSQPLVSHHLRILHRTGLVQSRRSDGFVLYAIDPAGLRVARNIICELFDLDLATAALPGGNTNCCR